MAKAARSSRARRMERSRCSSPAARGETAAGSGPGRSRPSGSRSSARRSVASALPKSSTRHSASRAERPWRSAHSRSWPWASWSTSHRARARVGPMARRASRSAPAGDSREPSARRDSTQPLLWPSSRPMPEAVSPSSLASEQTTRASSRAVTVRGGALASSSRRFCSAAETGRSTTTGTRVAPCSRQRSRRLKPSRTSKPPSSQGATRSGSSASCTGAHWASPGRNRTSPVRSWSMETCRIAWDSGMALPSRRPRASEAPLGVPARSRSEGGGAVGQWQVRDHP